MIATKDIICYKIVRKLNDKLNDYKGAFMSEYQYFVYEPKVIYKLGGMLKVHSASPTLSLITKGFHSYSRLSSVNNSINLKEEWGKYDLSIVECIIPKGSTYYYNNSEHEYVSDSIKIIKSL